MNKRKCITLFYVVFLLITNSLFADLFPELIVRPDGKIQAMLDLEPDNGKKNPIKCKERWKKIIKSLKKIYSEMWSDFDSKGKSTLPWCIYEVFNRLKGLGNIYIYFSIKGDKIPSGSGVTVIDNLTLG